MAHRTDEEASVVPVEKEPNLSQGKHNGNERKGEKQDILMELIAIDKNWKIRRQSWLAEGKELVFRLTV